MEKGEFRLLIRLTYISLILKLMGVVDWSWGLVFIPLMVMPLLMFGGYIAKR